MPEETDSDDEYLHIDIKKRLIEYRKEHKDARVPKEMLDEAVRWRLNQNDCQNRGYVLDGFPRSYEDAFGVFFVQNKKPEPKFTIDEATGEKVPVPDEMDEDALKEFLKPKFQKNIYPDSVIVLRGTKELLHQKLSKLGADAIKGTHWVHAEQDRRFAQWYELNAISKYGTDKPPLARFFQENSTELFEVDCDGENFEMFESMRIYIERDGRPYNYLKSVGELNKQREQHLTEEEQKWREGLQQEEDLKHTQDKEKRAKLEEMAYHRLKSIYGHMKELESADKLNMRQFLMKYIIPVLTEGMIECCKVGPIDPVDYLAEYIFKRSSEFREVKQQ